MMTITVLIAEDEPVARQQIKLLLKRYPAFSIAGEAENGEEACKMLRALQPDLVFTDINMPGKSGIDFLEYISREYPGTESIVISGYSEFEYAQSAIKYGSSDYLLKPLNLKQFKNMMERMEEKIHKKQEVERTALLENMVQRKPVEEKRLKKYFYFSSYHTALLRNLGLPDAGRHQNTVHPVSEIEEIHCMYGRDSQETLFIWPAELFSVSDFIQRHRRKQRGQTDYNTLVICREEIHVSEIPETVSAMYRTMQESLVLGKSQILYLGEKAEKPRENEKRASFNQKEIQLCIERKDWSNAERLISETLEKYESVSLPLSQEKLMVNRMLLDLDSVFQKNEDFSVYMDELYEFSRDITEFKNALLDFIKSRYEESTKEFSKIDTTEFFRKIMDYIGANTEKQITLADLSEKYGISQSYLSRLFKKYASVSFHEYLTTCRIKEACRVFAENPEWYVKDVAALVGIADQFHFSRLFKSVTGKTPTQYCQEILQNRK